jgi:hypothetical protein
MMRPMPACPANRRPWLRRALVPALLPAALVAAAALGGCYATDPVLYPFAPSPNVPEGLLILQVPHEVVESMHSTHIADELGSVLLGDALKIGYEPITEERRQQILSHQVVTGMTLREVTWSLMSDPARIRDQGPPGGKTLIWETPGGMQGSFWVRFDDDGHAWDAGSY